MLPVVGRGALVGEGEQGHELHPGRLHRGGPLHHLVADPSLAEIADEDHDGVRRTGDPRLAVGECTVDVRTAAELRAEEDVDRVVELVGEVDDGRVEDDEAGRQGPHRGEHRAEDGGVDDGGGHGARLVDAEDDVLLHGPVRAPVPDETLGHHGAGPIASRKGHVVPEVGPDRAVPVDVAVTWPTAPGRAVQGTGERRPRAGGQPALQVLDDLAYDGARRLLGRLRHGLAEREQGADQMDVGFDRLQHLRLQQQGGEPEPVHRVALHDLDDGGRKVRTDVAEPAGHARGGCPEPRGTICSAPAARFPAAAVQRGQRSVHRGVACGELVSRAVGAVRAEHQAPAPQPLVLGGRSCVHVPHPLLDVRPVRGHPAAARSAGASGPSSSRSTGTTASARSSSNPSPKPGVPGPPSSRALPGSGPRRTSSPSVRRTPGS